MGSSQAFVAQCGRVVPAAQVWGTKTSKSESVVIQILGERPPIWGVFSHNSV
jgi:hypothetical protein